MASTVDTDRAWEALKRTLRAGPVVRGTVTGHAPFGIFVDVPDVPFAGLVQITEFKDGGRMTPGEYPPVGSEVTCVVLGFKESGKQVWLGMRPSQLNQGPS